MTKRIDNLFTAKQKDILSIFVTAGFPKPGCTLQIIRELENSGADLVEVGIPFSDPLADGPVIQNSSTLALEGGMSLKKIFDELKEMRPSLKIPVLLMGYLNSVLQFGTENFYRTCHEVGIDGLIFPDLSIDEYIERHQHLAEQYGIDIVFLITPETKPERIKLIDRYSKGFIYLVSSNATTGTGNGISDALERKVEEIKSLQLKNPILIGFGVKGAKEFKRACALVNGAIIGSSFVSMLQNSKDLKNDIQHFIQQVKLTAKPLQS